MPPVPPLANTPPAAVTLSETALRDVELVLLGVLAREVVCGGSLTSTPPELGAPGTSGLTALAWADEPADTTSPATAPAAAAAAEDGAKSGAADVELRDEESTPVAVLTQARLLADGSGLVGRLAAGRARESGAGRAHALTEADLRSGWADVLLLARPLTRSEERDLEATWATREDAAPRLVLVPDLAASTDGVPTATMLAVAAATAHRLGAELLTAPLAWRDAQTGGRDGHTDDRTGTPGDTDDRTGTPVETDDRVGTLVAALHRALGAPLTVARAGDGGPGAAAWAQARAALDDASPDPSALEAFPDDVVEHLRRWRRPRADRGLVLLFTGLSGSGKSTLARALAARLQTETTRTLTMLDGDVVRQLLSSGLGFDRESRLTNLRRIGWVAAEVARHGGVAVAAPIAPYAAIRAEMRAMAEAAGGDLVLVHVSTPLAECERRDLKGLYAKARAGLIPEFTGISDPYEPPTDADLTIDTSAVPVPEAVTLIIDHLTAGGWITGEPHGP